MKRVLVLVEGQTEEAFINSVVTAFEEAHVEYVLLHGYETEGEIDSDVDVAIGRQSGVVADAVIRTGVLGQVVQCFYYGAPWCNYFVLLTSDAARPAALASAEGASRVAP